MWYFHIWMVYAPFSVRWDNVYKDFGLIGEFSLDYPVFTSGFVLANPGLTNTIKLGAMYKF